MSALAAKAGARRTIGLDRLTEEARGKVMRAAEAVFSPRLVDAIASAPSLTTGLTVTDHATIAASTPTTKATAPKAHACNGRPRRDDPHPHADRKSQMKAGVARVALATFRKGWLLPANWDIAHWFERDAAGGWQTACGKRVRGFYKDRGGDEIAYPPGAHTTCRRCAGAMR